jgi:hypothetical protein
MKTTARMAAIAAALACLCAPAARAATASITGGECTFSDFSTGGLLLFQSCTNTRGSPATDLHLNLTYSDGEGGVINSLTRNLNFQFDEIANGGTYTAGPLTVVWNNSAIVNAGVDAPSWEDVTVTGNWTPAVPEPETYALMLSGLGILAFAARRRGAARTDAATGQAQPG